TTITVQVSDGSLATAMPNVVGAQLRDARNAINAAGFTGGIAEQYVLSGADVRCQVASSDPGAGAAVAKSARVTLTINGGPSLSPGN
ncbi:PASTA domain-containing protein, partial [Escherichia coli]|nr:PASTA domain-containing protein [Escherichia coli]